MTERLQIELDDIRKRFKIEPDADDIIKLYEACKRVDAPFHHSNLALIGSPVEVGGVSLWPLTIGASIWLDEYAEKWWGKSDTIMYWALVFAFVRGRERDLFISMTDEKKAYKKVKSTIMRLACNRRELDNAIDILSGHKEAIKHEDASSEPDWEMVISELEVISGIPAEQWLWGKSASYTARAYLEHRKMLNTAAGNKTECTDALDDALTALAQVKKQIWIKHSHE